MLLLMLSLTTSAQNKYPIVVNEGGVQVVKMTKVQADDLKNKVKLTNKENLSLKKDSSRLKNERDSLEKEVLKYKELLKNTLILIT